MELPVKIRKHLSNTIWYHATSLEGWLNLCQHGVLAEYNKETSDALDFGFGFYMTTTSEKAESYINGLFKAEVYKHSKAVILSFNFSPLHFFEDSTYNSKVLDAYNDEFAVFIFENRTENIGGKKQHPYDIIFGVMSDSVPVKIVLDYKMGTITKECSIETLKKSTSMKQLSLHNQNLCDILKLQEAYQLDLATFERKGLDTNDYRKQRVP